MTVRVYERFLHSFAAATAYLGFRLAVDWPWGGGIRPEVYNNPKGAFREEKNLYFPPPPHTHTHLFSSNYNHFPKKPQRESIYEILSIEQKFTWKISYRENYRRIRPAFKREKRIFEIYTVSITNNNELYS